MGDVLLLICSHFFLKIFYLFIFRERVREKERERNINVWLPLMGPPTGDLACNPGTCPDWELNQQPFGLQPALTSLSYTSQGLIIQFCLLWCKFEMFHLKNYCKKYLLAHTDFRTDALQSKKNKVTKQYLRCDYISREEFKL